MSDVALPPPRPAAGSTVAGSRSVFLLAGLALLLLVAFVIGLTLGIRGWDVAVLGLALVTAFMGAFPIVFDMGRPPQRRQLVISLLALVYMIFLVMPVFTNYFPLRGGAVRGHWALALRLPQEVAHAQVVALIGFLMLMIGFYLPIGRFVVSGLPKVTRDWSPNASVAVAFSMLAMGWAVYLASTVGIIPERAGSGALGTISSGSVFGIFLLAITWLRYRRRDLLPFIVVIVALAMFFNFFTGSKRQFLTPLFMVALAYLVYERRIRKGWVVAGMALLVIVYPVSEFYREVMGSDGPRARKFLQDPMGVLQDLSAYGGTVDTGSYLVQGVQATGARLDALSSLALILRDTPERVPFQGGWTLGLIAVSYVPRVLWPEKPATTTGHWVSQTYGSPYDLQTDVGPSWIGELYFNWGYTGAFLGMLVIGVLCRVLQEVFLPANAPIPILLGSGVVLYCVCRSVQSSLMGPINGTVYLLAPIPVAHVLVGLLGGFRRQQARTSEIAPGQATSSP